MNQHRAYTSQAGFTLTELMIVIVIVGVLAAFGMPAYNNYARAAKRSDATQALSQMAQLQERFFTDNNSYAVNAKQLGFAVNTPTTTGGYWQMQVIDDGDITTFSVRATPAGTHVDTDCASLTLDSTGTQSHTGTGQTCWKGR